MQRIPFEQIFPEHVPLLEHLKRVNAIPLSAGHAGFGAGQVKFAIKDLTREDCEKTATFIRMHLLTVGSYYGGHMSDHVSLEIEKGDDRYGAHNLVFTAKTDESEELLRALFHELKK